MSGHIIKYIRKVLTKLLWLLSILIIVFVLLLSLFKLSLPYLLKDKAKIESYIEQAIGGDFSYNTISVDWTKFKPAISINQAQWVSSNNTLSIKSEKSDVLLDVWSTIYYGFLQTDSVELENISAEFLLSGTQDNGDFEFDLNKIRTFISRKPELIEQKYISLKNVNIVVKNKDQQVKFLAPFVQYEKIKEQRQIIIESRSELFSRGRFIIESDGMPLADEGSLNVYSLIEDFDALEGSQFLEQSLNTSLDIVDIEAWLTFKGVNPQKGILKISADSELSVTANLDVALHYEVSQQGLHFYTDSFRLVERDEDGNLHSHQSSFALKQFRFSDYSDWVIRAEDMPINYLSHLALPILPNEIVSYIKQAEPKGLLHDVKMTLRQQDSKLLPLAGYADVRDIKMKAYNGYPGGALSNIYISKEPQGWRYQVEAHNGSFEFPEMFLEPITIEKLQVAGLVSMRDGIRADIDSFLFINSDGAAKAYGFFAMPDNQPANLSLYAEGNNIQIAELKKYWPRNGFPENVLNFLDKGLQAGTVDFAKLVFRGDFDTFPYNEYQGQFNTQAFLSNAALKFDEDWPAATDIKAHAIFDNDAMRIKADKGRLSDNNLNSAYAEIKELSADDPLLLIKAQAISSYQSYRNLYLNSPLNEWLGDDLVNLKFNKPVTSDLGLQILLADEVEAKVDGKVIFDQQSISGIPYSIELHNVEGELRYTEKGAYANQLRGLIWDNPVVVDLKVADYTKNGELVQIDAQSHVDLNTLKKIPEVVYPLKTQGRSDVNFHYQIDENSNESMILRSDLIGTSIEGPMWLGKTTEEQSPLLMTLFKSQEKISLRTVYRNSMSSKIEFDPDNSDHIRGVIALGDMATTDIDYPDTGIVIEGYFAKISITEWLDSFALETSSKTSFHWPKWIKRIQFITPLLEVAGQQIHDVKFNDERSIDNEVRFNITSQEGKGHITFYDDGRKHVAVEHLDINLRPFSELASSDINLEKNALANWQLECDSCVINGVDTGVLTLVSRMENNQVKLQGDSKINEMFTAYIDGVWQGDDSQVKVNFSSPNAGELLKLWGFGDGLSETSTEGELALNWPGGFHQFELAKVNGNITINTGKGAITELSDKQARVFSLLSLQSIRRRLSLDFTDLFGEGFFYEKIAGNFSVKNGIVTSDDVKIEGTSADVEIKGLINLSQQTVDQSVLITPKISSSLPVLAGWAIEPTTGLIMLLVNKIFQPVIDVVVSLEYKVVGDIANPQVIEVSKRSKEIVVPDSEVNKEMPDK